MPFGDLPEAEGNEARRRYFEELKAEFESGGPEAMMHDLMQWDWRQVDLRKPPVTEALAEQMARTFSSAEEWLITVLTAGGFVDEDCNVIPGGEWDVETPTSVATSVIVESYRQHVRAYDGRGASPQRIVRFLREFGEITKTRMTTEATRPWGYRFGPRREWEARVASSLKVDFEAAAAEVVPIRPRGRAA